MDKKLNIVLIILAVIAITHGLIYIKIVGSLTSEPVGNFIGTEEIEAMHSGCCVQYVSGSLYWCFGVELESECENALGQHTFYNKRCSEILVCNRSPPTPETVTTLSSDEPSSEPELVGGAGSGGDGDMLPPEGM